MGPNFQRGGLEHCSGPGKRSGRHRHYRQRERHRAASHPILPSLCSHRARGGRRRVGRDPRHQQGQEPGRGSARSRSTNWTRRWRPRSRSTTPPTPSWSRPRPPREDNEKKLAAVEADLDEARARLTDRIVEIYKEGHLGVLDTLVGSASFSDLINRLDLMERLSKQDSDLVAQVTAYQEEVTARKAELAKQIEDQKRYIAEAAAAEQKVEAQLAAKKKALKGKEAQIAQLEKEEAARQAALAAAAKKAAEEARKAREAAAAAARATTTTTHRATTTTHTSDRQGAPPRPGTPAPPSAARPPPSARRPPPGRPPPRRTRRRREAPPVATWSTMRSSSSAPRTCGPGPRPSGFDCSGFAMYVYKHFGISLPHSSSMQSGYGAAVSRADLQPGDLVFFFSPIHHVGIYIGGGKMVNAAGTGKGVRIDYLWSSYNCARRIHPLGAGRMAPIAVYYHPLFLEHETGEHPENKRRLVVARQALARQRSRPGVGHARAGAGLGDRPRARPGLHRVRARRWPRGRRLAGLGHGGVAATPTRRRCWPPAPGSWRSTGLCETGQKAFMLVRPPGPSRLSAAGAWASASSTTSRWRPPTPWRSGGWSGCSSSTGTCTTATAPRPCSTASPGCSSSARTRPVTIPARGWRGRWARATRPGTRSTCRCSRARATARCCRRSNRCWRRWRGPSSRNSSWSRPATTRRRAIRSAISASRETSFQWMAARLVQLAEETGAAGPLCFLEGGYVPEMMAASVVATLKGLGGEMPRVRAGRHRRRAGRRARDPGRDQALLEGRLLARLPARRLVLEPLKSRAVSSDTV